MDLCTLSRAINRATGGDPAEMLCSRAHRLGWRCLTAPIDAAFYLIRREKHHCRECWRWENGA